MGRAPCCSKVGLQRGPWTPHEDSFLINYIQAHGEGLWRSLPKKAGLFRCGKSCRLRWLNYLRPDIKRGNITPDEDDLIVRLHALLGNRWSLISGRLPGRTDNEIKNYWNTHLSKRLRSEGMDPNTHKKLSEPNPIPPKRKRSTNSETRKKQNNYNNTSQNQGNAGPIWLSEESPKIHMPKQARMTSVSVLNINDSLDASNVTTNVSATTSNGSGGEELVAPCWPSDHDVMPYDGMMMLSLMTEEQGGMEHPHASDLDKIYEEYLQVLLKVPGDGFDDGNYQAEELISFAESLLI